MTTDLATSSTRRGSPPARRRRRLLLRLLVGALALGLAGVLGLVGLAVWFWSQADMSNVGQLGFANQLKIPPLLEPRLDGAGRKVFGPRLQQAPASCWPASGPRPGAPTAPTWDPRFGPLVATRS